MKRILFLLAGILFANLVIAQNPGTGTFLFDSDWLFHRGGAQGAEGLAFDDSSWQPVDLPHDWSIENLPGTNSPFNRNAISQVSGGFTTGGTGWYRKSFTVPSVLSGGRVILVFEGVYMNPEIWINGFSLGSHPYGYTSFWFDITDHVRYGTSNIIAVKVRNEGENSRWYSGSGIYRHVWLKILNPVHVAQWGIRIATSDVSEKSATVNTEIKLNNQSDKAVTVKLGITLIDTKGGKTGSYLYGPVILKEGQSTLNYELKIKDPDLWSPETPSLYTAVTEVYLTDSITDRVESRFGIRTISFDVNSGFKLNGETIKLKGGCFHDDNGPLGSKSFDRAEERRVELMKASGFNAVRCSHNPPAPAFLDACDRLGMLVIDETFDMWNDGKNEYDYHLYFRDWWKKDVASMINRDYNHPSIILWSIGNEIPGMNKPEVVKTARTMVDFVHSADPTRPVTAAVNGLNPDKDPFFAVLDIAGYNYGSGGDHKRSNIFDEDHERIPSRIMVQTESYPFEAFQSWMDVLDHTWLTGDFVWTGFDYIGEASIGWKGYMQKQDFYPWNLAFCGDIDICGWKRPQSFYRDALWKEDQLSLFVKPPLPSFPENPEKMFWSKWNWYDHVADWNWKGYEGNPIEVTAYSSCDEAELFLNGVSLGKKKTDRSTEFKNSWDVPYQAGELKVIGYSRGKKVNTATLNTAAEPTHIILSADQDILKANGQDLSYVTIELKDNMGYRNPKSENMIQFEIDGPGTIIATGNANPVSLESFTGHQRKAWQGRCLAVIRSGKTPGKLTLKASSPGLKPASVEILIK